VTQAVRLCEICGGQNGTKFSPFALGFHCHYRSASALFFTRVLVPEDFGTVKQNGASDIGEQWVRKKEPSLFFFVRQKASRISLLMKMC
jgi:hypothetical protein